MSFPTTHWSLLAEATWDGTAQARKALETLCGRYWGPIHVVIRARGITDPEAQDLTQDFMVHLLEKSLFLRANPLRGRFRSFLLGALVRFLADAKDKRTALKRGGGVSHASLEGDEFRRTEELLCPPDAAQIFDREWALTILESALERVRCEYAEHGHQALFAALRQFLPGSGEVLPYETAAQRLEIPLGTLKTEVHRLRRRLRALVCEEVAQTVSAPHELEGEIAHLQAVLMERGLELAPRL